MLNFRKRKHRFLLAALAVVFGVAVSPVAVRALVPTLNASFAFGGIIVWNHPCTMTTLGSPAWYMVVLDKSAPYVPFPMVLLPPPLSRLNMYFAPIIGNSILGSILTVPGLCTLTLVDYLPYIGFVPPFPYPGIGTSLVPLAGNVL